MEIILDYLGYLVPQCKPILIRGMPQKLESDRRQYGDRGRAERERFEGVDFEDGGRKPRDKKMQAAFEN